MADTTARYGFPFQEATDPPDGASLGQDLAEAVEATIGDIEDRGKLFIERIRFTANGNFVKASYPDATLARVQVQGGGGAGGGSPATAAATVSAGGGGQGGSYAESYVDVATMAASVTVTVGAAGAAGSGASGGTGGTSSFGATVSAAGGIGGQAIGAGGT